MKRSLLILVLIALIIILAVFIESRIKKKQIQSETNLPETAVPVSSFPDTSQVPATPYGDLVRYGKSLIANTAFYFGPNGKLQHVSNRLNCQNCHLAAGMKEYGNNFLLVANGYPRYKERSGSMESLVKKVEDCFERSLNGKIIDSNSREMKAFIAYLGWVGAAVKKGEKPKGTGLEELPFMDRAADTLKGKIVFENKCMVCHGKNGQGQELPDSTGTIYPPLWGPDSYNVGASIYRLSKFAGFVKSNMPFGATHDAPQLTNEEAWDVAAYVNSQFHPSKDLSGDWPVLGKKPYDYPFGPYADAFSEKQHKYGPFAPIKNFLTGDKK